MFDINTFEDLIQLAKNADNYKDNKDIQKLAKIKKHLKQLNKMVGMDDMKQQIVYQILFFIQKLDDGEMMHTALMGPPGVGKTSVAKILADIYKHLGFLSKGKLIVATRENLVGQYLGETAIKTRKMLDYALGSVLFIDEAYSLGNGSDKGDYYAKECVDTLTAFLSEHTDDFVCIIAGYENELKHYFFDSNPGLDRRFPWKYVLPNYKSEELKNIYLRLLKDDGWRLRKILDCEEELDTIFCENKENFMNNGGDVHTFINFCKMAHGKRVFGTTRSYKRHLTVVDIKKGYILYNKQRKGKLSKQYEQMVCSHMYL